MLEVAQNLLEAVRDDNVVGAALCVGWFRSVFRERSLEFERASRSAPPKLGVKS